MRGLAKEAGVTVGYISGVEAGRISPTIATLRKLLLAMDTDLGAFFAGVTDKTQSFVFRRSDARTVLDENRSYTFLLPRRRDIQLDAVEEVISPGETPEFETLTSDMAGIVVKGQLTLEVENEGKEILKEGDSFYITAGKPVRGGSAATNKSVKIITLYVPPRY